MGDAFRDCDRGAIGSGTISATFNTRQCDAVPLVLKIRGFWYKRIITNVPLGLSLAD
jgi:hypothetical protein